MDTTAKDPILREIIRYALDAIVDEMAVALVRSAYSINLKSTMDMCCALCDRSGRLIVQGLTLPLHLASIPEAMRAVQRKFNDDIAPGDVIILNDPYDGGSHLPDVFAFRPVFYEGRHIAWSVSEAHQLDVGGKTPGGNGCDATEIYQEGLRIPPLKLMEAGKPCAALYTLIETNVRVPRHVLGDIRAQLAACATGEAALLKLIARHGEAVLFENVESLLDVSEAYARAAIEAFPDGSYGFTDYLDSDGITDDPVVISVTITVAGDRMAVDFAGSSPQVRGSINSVMSFSRSAVYATFRNVVGGDPPNNEGFFRPISVTAPEGSVVNSRMPAAVAARGLTGFRVANVLFGAFAKIAPDRVYACEVGGDSGISFGGYQADGTPFILLEFLSGSWGGRPTQDGIDGFSSAVVNFSNNPVEMIEWEYPLTILAYGYVPDTGGAGQYRGGLALERTYRFEVDDGSLQLRTDRVKFQPYGLHGGQPGTVTQNVLIRDGVAQTLAGKCTLTVQRGDVFHHILAGAGGWGDPGLRDAGLIEADLLNGKITAAAAKRQYGVEIDGTFVRRPAA